MTELSTRLDTTPFEAIKRVDAAGEHWSARDLMPLLGYERWASFADAIDRAIAAAHNAGHDSQQAFSRRPEKGTGGRPRDDYRLTRYAAYLIAMNGDPRKPEIAAAWHLVPQTIRVPGGLACADANDDLAREFAEVARAARYEAVALASEARGGCGR